MTLEPDRGQIEIFVNAIFRHAQTGFVSLRAFFEGSNDVFRRTPIRIIRNNLKFLCDAVEDDARRAAQHPKPVVFCPPLASFDNDKNAAEDNIVEGLTITVECDETPTDAREKLEAILGPATTVVRSGGTWNDGNGITQDKLHLHWRLATPARGKDDLDKLKRVRQICADLVNADPTSIPICHPIRWPGSWHRKNQPRLAEIVACDPDIEIELADALARLEPLAPAPAPSNNRGGQPGGEWDTLGGNILAGQKLHSSIARLAMKMLRGGTPEVMAVQTLRMMMDASQAPRDDRWQLRYDDIPRAVASAGRKLAAEQAAAAAAAVQPQPSPAPSSPPPPPPPPPPGVGVGPAASSSVPPLSPALEQTHAIFKKWLGKAYDIHVLNAVLAAAAVERLTGDPLWLLVISGSANAKTETVRSLAGAGALITSTITSEGALLSATGHSRGATGGLLKKIGARGTLVIKDMTSLLEMDVRARGLVLAALREVYDGKWERNVGTGGGRTLPWEGRIVVIGCCTTAWDAAHSVIALWARGSSSCVPIQSLGASAQRCAPSAIPVERSPCEPSWQTPLRPSSPA
jgi:hypothetical protein